MSPLTGATVAGTFSSSLALQLDQIVFPEFFKQRSLNDVSVRIFTSECRYDIIFGRDVCTRLGLHIDFENKILSWDDAVVATRPYPVRSPFDISNDPVQQLATELYMDVYDDDLQDDCACGICDRGNFTGSNDETLTSDIPPVQSPLHMIPTSHPDHPSTDDDEDLGYKSKTIKASTYAKTDISQLVTLCTHLTKTQQLELHALLSN